MSGSVAREPFSEGLAPLPLEWGSRRAGLALTALSRRFRRIPVLPRPVAVHCGPPCPLAHAEQAPLPPLAWRARGFRPCSKPQSVSTSSQIPIPRNLMVLETFRTQGWGASLTLSSCCATGHLSSLTHRGQSISRSKWL